MPAEANDLSHAHDTSWRYEEPGKAAAFVGRSGHRNHAEANLVAAVVADVDLGCTLDAACGAGRLRPLLEENGATWIGVDASSAMLGEAGPGRVAKARIQSLPFDDGAFDSVVCFRFLHHLPPEAQREVVAELARVCRTNLVLSAFHPLSLHGWQRRLRSRWQGKTPSRWAISPATLAAWLDEFQSIAIRRQGTLRDLWVGMWRRQLSQDAR